MREMELLNKGIFGRNNERTNRLQSAEISPNAGNVTTAVSAATNSIEQAPSQDAGPKKVVRAWLRDKWDKAKEFIAEAEPVVRNLGKIALRIFGAASAFLRLKKEWKESKKQKESQRCRRGMGMLECLCI